MIDEEKLETLKNGFISDMPFELPIVHIHQDTMPTLDHSKDSFEYAIKFIVQRQQKEINDEIMKNIRQIMKEKGISEYYSIDEKRLLEIIEEAKAFEMIKDTFSLRQALIEACDKTTSSLRVMPQRKRFVKEMLIK